ncbi:hypothetical protein [Paenibacillus beijingensis]|uniref:Uncharacterized protein n=1 Tax=Paenibacillus beijingensis TaxID=1126833 RepID=A0A0D5NFD1_9BACL|nr:hypothetical protein [Paenibacillus beijingensis]AJY73855.1 hypothetical protein VN24_03540 [Paenibacillus beijingensis]
MYKLLFVIVMMTVWLAAHALQTDQELAVQTLFRGKHAVNRAAHAAAQQLDAAELAEGRLIIDESAASAQAARYLQANLQLDGAGNPLPGSFLKERVEVLAFEVVNGDRAFPYTYRSDLYDYDVTLHKPGVVLIVRLAYPRAFQVMEPIEWEIKGTAELTGY